MHKNYIELKNVSVKYPATSNFAIENVNLKIDKGQLIVIIGESGSGKTTLLKVINKLIAPNSGSVSLDGSIATVFQNGAVFPWMSVYDNVALPLKLRGTRGIKKKVESSLTQVGILHLKDQLPKNLSGGQRQRVGIARALAYNTDIILMDEPFSALDMKTAAELHKDILALWQKTGKTIIIISHLLEEAVLLGQEIILLKNGKLIKKFQNSLDYPRNEMSHDFLNLIQEMKRNLKVEE